LFYVYHGNEFRRFTYFTHMIDRIAKKKPSADRTPTFAFQIAPLKNSMFGAGRFSTAPGFNYPHVVQNAPNTHGNIYE